jgi:hypothetical protein
MGIGRKSNYRIRSLRKHESQRVSEGEIRREENLTAPFNGFAGQMIDAKGEGFALEDSLMQHPTVREIYQIAAAQKTPVWLRIPSDHDLQRGKQKDRVIIDAVATDIAGVYTLQKPRVG